eukprot:TRINITY_DN29108_c0_g1_i1.p1 TRINITY_DN29108_c0_g1~~TRINITY_DN29108_c0_g1_i1.p1  ORF type:complete len:184 (-),score=24.35 TRINITY_DN29108_c0_g1_i1:159-710(-)
MARAIVQSSNLFQMWQTCWCLNQAQCGAPGPCDSLRDTSGCAPTGNNEQDIATLKPSEAHEAERQRLLDRTLQTLRWRSRDTLQRDYHDVFKANNRLLHEVFIAEQGVYTAEAVEHFMGTHNARSAVLIVGVAHQSAVEQHLCDAHGYTMCVPTATQLIQDAKKRNPSAFKAASSRAQPVGGN